MRGLIFANSTFELPAKEVYRLAIASIAEIEGMRQRAVKEAIRVAQRARVRTWWGGTANAFTSEEDAMENFPLVEDAKSAASTDMELCELARDTSKYLMEKFGEDYPMRLTLNDYRGLS